MKGIYIKGDVTPISTGRLLRSTVKTSVVLQHGNTDKSKLGALFEVHSKDFDIDVYYNEDGNEKCFTVHSGIIRFKEKTFVPATEVPEPVSNMSAEANINQVR